MEGNSDYALWIDADMLFPENTISRLLSRDKKIVGANYRRRHYPKTTFTAANGNLTKLIEVQTTNDSPPLEKVEFLPGGMMMIHREVYQTTAAPYYLIQYNPRFNLEIGEDYYFCEKVRSAGHEIWIDHELSREVAHIGTFSYSCNLPFKS
jgi:hypothetical protein